MAVKAPRLGSLNTLVYCGIEVADRAKRPVLQHKTLVLKRLEKRAHRADGSGIVALFGFQQDGWPVAFEKFHRSFQYGNFVPFDINFHEGDVFEAQIVDPKSFHGDRFELAREMIP